MLSTTSSYRATRSHGSEIVQNTLTIVRNVHKSSTVYIQWSYTHIIVYSWCIYINFMRRTCIAYNIVCAKVMLSNVSDLACCIVAWASFLYSRNSRRKYWLKLRLWFVALWLLCHVKHSESSHLWWCKLTGKFEISLTFE